MHKQRQKGLEHFGTTLGTKKEIIVSKAVQKNKWLDAEMRQNHAVTQELTVATKAMLIILKNLPGFASEQTLVSGDRCFPLQAQCSLAANVLL